MEKNMIRWSKWRKEQLERCLKEQKDMDYMTKILGLDEQEINAYINASNGNVVDFANAKDSKVKATIQPLQEEKASLQINGHIAQHLIKLLEKINFYQDKVNELEEKLQNDKLPASEQFRLDFLIRYYSTHRDHYEEQYEQVMDVTVSDFYNRETIK
jgi:hypothetical protein